MEHPQKPKVLIALSRFPYPVTDGTRYKLLRNVSDALKADFDLEYLVVTVSKVASESLAQLERDHGRAHVVRISRAGFFLRSLRSAWDGLPFQANGYRTAAASRFLRAHIGDYAAVYAHTIRMAGYVADFPAAQRSRVILDFNDALSLNYRGAKTRSRFPLSLGYRIEEGRVRNYERALLARFARATVVSPYDRAYLLDLLPASDRECTNLICIQYGVPPVPAIAPVPVRQAIYFVGQLDYDMNREALAYFLDSIWPSLKSAMPELEFRIVGRGRTETYARYASLDGVRFLGFVDDLYAAVQDCLCLVAPLRSGAGMPTKIVEALSYRIPVISTPLGVRGIEGAESGTNMLVIDESDVSAWVAAVRSLANDQALRERLGSNGRTLFEERYELSRVQALWRGLFKRIAGVTS